MLGALRILPGPTADSGWALCPPVVLKFDSASYFFNVPEGTSRTMSQRRGPTLGFNNNQGAIFVPATHAEAMGGLHGFLMGIADSAKSGKRTKVKLIGAPNFKHAIAAGRSFNKRSTISLEVVEASFVPPSVQSSSMSHPALTSISDSNSAQTEPVLPYGVQLLHADSLVKVYGVQLHNSAYDFTSVGKEEEASEVPLFADSDAAVNRNNGSLPHPAKRAKLSNDSTDEQPEPRSGTHFPKLKLLDGSLQQHEDSSTTYDPSVDPAPWDTVPAWYAGKLRKPDAARLVDAIIADMYKYRPGAKAFEPEEPRLEAQPTAQSPPRANEEKLTDGKQALQEPVPMGTTPAWLRHRLPPAPLSTRHAPRFPRNRAEAVDSALPPVTLTYIVETPARRGNMDAAKAAAIGVPAGPALGVLAAGRSIELKRPEAWEIMDVTGRKAWLDAQRKAAQVGKGKKQNNKKKETDMKGEQQTPLTEMKVVEFTVTPDMVLEPSQPGSVFIQTYLPSVSYLPSLLGSRAFDRYKQASSTDTSELQGPANVILHCVTAEVLADERYQTWMKSFPPETDHIISSPDFCPNTLNYPSAALAQLRLSKIDDSIFRLPKYSLQPKRSLQSLGDGVLPEHSRALDGDLRIRFAPYIPHDCSDATRDISIPRFDFEHDNLQARDWLASSAENLEVDMDRDSLANTGVSMEADVSATGATPSLADRETVRQRLERARAQVWPKYLEMAARTRSEVQREAATRQPAAAGSILDKVIITPLGTGSATPSKYRNVSGTLISAPDCGNILLDAGESTYGQLCRHFGDKIDNVLRDLKVIFISHIHADHHLGLTRLLNARERLWPPPREEIFIIVNRHNRTALAEHDSFENLGFRSRHVRPIWSSMINIDSEDMTHRSSPQGSDSRKAVADLMKQMNLTQLNTILVTHRTPQCYGIILKHRDGWSVSYSGDTMPCKAMENASKGVTVLIHEATLEDGQEEMAAAKGHSTFGQAIQLAKNANAEHCFLTHFSQRYPKLARLGGDSDQSAGSLGPTVAMAFDLISLPISDLWKMDRYRPAMELLYQADGDAERDKDKDKDRKKDEEKQNERDDETRTEVDEQQNEQKKDTGKPGDRRWKGTRDNGQDGPQQRQQQCEESVIMAEPLVRAQQQSKWLHEVAMDKVMLPGRRILAPTAIVQAPQGNLSRSPHHGDGKALQGQALVHWQQEVQRARQAGKLPRLPYHDNGKPLRGQDLVLWKQETQKAKLQAGPSSRMARKRGSSFICVLL
ncbi:hypothetical protein K437DRAFT_31797 [Tilletiaria anomala UBC 951]|uniref:ribonuclease Z n=1 Tax=Tilletiaria anomala (strain ATCC 24038 / CBS 436.72 / UBC 951) TaxID=1037660 RepID=A0A066V900_TILAU|nr:uncharacterized protein K437DRAFT_31797 [Tilletiaria anomala UBC 951]KDN37931.1 hypothetical protein K437DRAFT_31797 [Tilletiaria anomala UBC 951]